MRALAASPLPYHILVGSRSVDNGNKAVADLQRELPDTTSVFTVVQVDISSDDSIQKAFEQVKGSPGWIDTLINNAGTLATATHIVRPAHHPFIFQRN